MDAAIKTQWLAALRSDEYKQGQGTLKAENADGTLSYCCLGVLCDQAEKAGVVVSELKIADACGIPDCTVCEEAGNTWHYDNETGHLPRKVQEWAGLENNKGRFTTSDSEAVWNSSLVTLNDVEELDFKEIADIIEANF